MQDEELFNDQQFHQFNQTLQSELITKRCAGVEARIRDAQSKEEAERIAGDACRQLEGECASTIIRTALAQYVWGKVARYWSDR
jgi:hypothetical protein